MGDDVIHVIVRAVDGGFYATSPQAPGLAYGRGTIDELRAGLDDVLAFHLDRPGPFSVVEHQEEEHQGGVGELVLRVALDDRLADREEAYNRLDRATAVPGQVEILLAGPRNRVGEVLYLCAVPTDTLGWLLSQLDPRGEGASAVVAIGDELLLTFALPDLAGLDSALTIADLMHDRPIIRPATVPLAG